MQNEWVICRVFQKSSGGKKIPISGLVRLGSFGSELGPSNLPPLMDSSPFSGKTKPFGESTYVPCFSNAMDAQRHQEGMVDSNSLYGVISNPTDMIPRIPLSSSYYSAQTGPLSGNLPFPGNVVMQDPSFLRALFGNQGSNSRQSFKPEREIVSGSQETVLTTDMNAEISSVVSNLEMGRRPFQEVPSTSTGPVGLENFWEY